MKRVALIGSSGGGTATLGHTDPVAFLMTLNDQLSRVEGNAKLVTALFVALDGGRGMDGVDELSPARCFHLFETKEGESKCEIIALGPLRQVNATCRERQQALLVEAIRDHKIDALICVSCHVGIFQETLKAASEREDFPVTGSGGTSLAQVASIFGIRLAGNAGGSVATTSLTKAVSYTRALAVAWDRVYQPWKSPFVKSEANRPTWTSVLNSCLPAFWGVCLTKKVLLAVNHVLESSERQGDFLARALFKILSQTVVALEHHTLPTACAVLMALSMRQKDSLSSESSLIMAAILGSSACYDSILAALVVGSFVATWSDRLLYSCIFWNIPATMTSMVIGGGLGGAVSVLVLPLAEFLRQCTSLIRHSLASVIVTKPWGSIASFFLGCLSCYGSKVGWYHSIHLPLILIEMELGDASYLGAIDELTLVLVCAGVCSAMVMRQPLKTGFPSSADAILCWRGVGINLGCGDFVEVCYPYMDTSPLINIGGYLASGLASAYLVWRAPEGVIPRSLAYLPLPVSVAIASSGWKAMVESMCIALAISFSCTLVSRK